jgi:hypothetical protein
MRKRMFLALFALVAAAPITSAQIARFAGSWSNVSASRGIVKVVVTPVGSGATVQVFGSCTPTPCDWGVQKATVYSPNVTSNPVTAAVAMTATYRFAFKEAIVVLKPDGPKGLAGEFYSRFTDSSGRSNYVLFERFVRR